MTESILELKYPRIPNEEVLVTPEEFPEKLAAILRDGVTSDVGCGLELVIGDDRTPGDMAPVVLSGFLDEELATTSCMMSSDMIGDLIEAVEDGLKPHGIGFAEFQGMELRNQYYEAMNFDDINRDQIKEMLSKNLNAVEIDSIEAVVTLWVEDTQITLTVEKYVNFSADLNAWRKVQARAAGLNIVVPDGPGTSRIMISSSKISSLPSFFIQE